MQIRPAMLLSDNLFGFAPGETILVEFHNGMITKLSRPGPADVHLLEDMGPGRLVDARGKLVLPGLVDAHVHAIAAGMMMLGVDCHGVSSRDELEAAIQTAAESGGDFVRLAGLDPSKMGDELSRIDRKWLDGLLKGRALYIKSVEGHSAWFNTRAWELVGVDGVFEKLNIPPETRAEMYSRGYVHGNSYENLTTPIYDSYSHEDRRRGLEMVIARAKQVGLTGLHCMEGYGDYRKRDFELVLELDRCADFDLTLYCRDATPKVAEELNVNRFGGCWCLDGAIAAHSAALAEPYADRPETDGELYYSDDEIGAWMESGLKLEMQVTVHAIGERALEQAVRVLEGLRRRYDLRTLRPRIEHWVMGTPELAARAAAVGAAGAVQPMFDALWGGTVGGYATRLGPERALRANPVRWLIDNGMVIAGSSDCYITPLDPLGGIFAAMNHHNAEQQVSFETAVRMFTEDAAYLAHQEHSRGRIAEEYWADFTVVDGDRGLNGARVAKTIKSGIVMYENNTDAG